MAEPPFRDETPNLPVPRTEGDGTIDAGLSGQPCGAGSDAAAERLGRYELHGEIGRGGMGSVLKGHDPDLKRTLALKVLRPEHRDNEPLRRRFLEEAQITGQLEHPGVPPVHELGRTADGRPFFTMKLVRGRTLAELLEERPSPSHDLPRFLAIFEQVAQTVAFAHAHGVLHRDLKPANVMVGRFGEVQVMDWGLAKVLTAAQTDDDNFSTIYTVRTVEADGASQAGTILGTPAFMAPEQARGEVARMDERCDVFGLGAILCVILTGQPPFVGETTAEVHRRARQGDLGDALARLEKCGADPELTRLAAACLAPEPAGRPPEAGAVAAAVSAYRANVEARLRAAEVERAAAQARAVEERKRRRVVIALAIAVVALLLLGAGVWRWREEQQYEAQRQREEQESQDRRRREVEQAEAEGEGQRLLEKAQDLWMQADKAAPGEVAPRAAALAEAREAEQRLAHIPASEELRQKVQHLAAFLEAQHKAHSLLARVEEIRLEQSDVRGHKIDRARTAPLYATAFLDHGVDAGRDEPAVVATVLRRSGLRVELAAALDDWAAIDPDVAVQQRLREVARQIDSDPWRTRVRDAVVKQERQPLIELARSPEAATLPAISVVLLGRALDEAGAAVEAIALLEKARERFPTDFWINVELGRLHNDRVDSDRVLSAADAALRYLSVAAALRGRDARVRVMLGHALSNKGMRREAIAAYQEGVHLQPQYVAAHYSLGLELRKAGKPKEAVASYREALRLDPENVHAHVALGNALMQLGKDAEAVASFEKAIELDRLDFWAVKGMGLALLTQGKHDETIAYLRGAICLNRDAWDAHFNLGQALALKGELDEAIVAYRQAIRLEPKASLVHPRLSEALVRKYKLPASAQTAFTWAVTIPKDYAHAYAGLGKALLDSKQYDEAITCYQTALGYKKDSYEAQFGLGSVKAFQGRWEEAVAPLREAVRLNPAQFGAHYALGVALSKQGKWAEALPLFRAAAFLSPQLAVAHKDLGDALWAQQQFPEAVAAYREAIRVKPAYPEAHHHLGMALQAQGKLPEAVVALKEAIRLRPKYPEAYYSLGVALRGQDKFAEAADAYREAIRLNPDYPEAHCNLGSVLREQGRFAESLEFYKRGDELGRKLPVWRYPSEQWVRDGQRLVELDGKLADFLKGDLKPADAAETLVLAQLCHYKRRQAAAAHFYEIAFTLDRKVADDLSTTHRYNAACYAALAAAGQGEDSPAADKDRARLRRQALDWLRANLTAWGKRLDGGKAEDRPFVAHQMRHWQTDRDLAGVRDKESLDKLPEEEGTAWRQLWADVEALRRRAVELK
jgi:serine/threonine-protein kinase